MDARTTRGQITAYATLVMGSQYRTHAFFVLIIGEYARLIRWDRSGAVVTERIKYDETSELFDFFMRYDLADSEARGHDSTVGTPTKEELERASQFVGEMDKTSFLAVSISPPGQTDPKRYIIPTPIARTDIPVGRWTRASRAYDLENQKEVFLKDTWRMVEPNILPESSVYKILQQKGVPNIPYCTYGDDVGDDKYHHTCTQTLITLFSESNNLIPYRHHRLILTPIARKLEDFRTSREMVTAVYKALVGKLTSC
jgi:hypothetical protein